MTFEVLTFCGFLFSLGSVFQIYIRDVISLIIRSYFLTKEFYTLSSSSIYSLYCKALFCSFLKSCITDIAI